MVNKEELVYTTEYLTLQTRCCINRRRYNQFKLYHVSFYVHLSLSSVHLTSTFTFNLKKFLISLALDSHLVCFRLRNFNVLITFGW
jgi:hypothetical protein